MHAVSNYETMEAPVDEPNPKSIRLLSESSRERTLMHGNRPSARKPSLMSVLTAGAVLALPLATAGAASGADPATGAVPRAECGPGSVPESGVQGQVPRSDRSNGRNQIARSCNLALAGSYQGQGSSWVNASYQHCAYMSAAYPGTLLSDRPGVRVVDASDPRRPTLSAVLDSPAMAGGSWESLKVNARRGLLGAVSGGPVVGVGLFDVYDVKSDCAKPKLLSSLSEPRIQVTNGLGHEGGWSPDGRTYWSSGLGLGSLTAIDVSDPTNPRIVWSGTSNAANHGFSLSPNGERLYLSRIAPAGVDIFDVSSIQHRSAQPGLRYIGSYTQDMNDGLISQHTVPFSKNGRSYLLSVDEAGEGGARILDLTDEANPSVVRKIRLQIQLPENKALREEDADGDGVFGYQSHYCSLDRTTDPTALACGYFQSGIRVFDIRDLQRPREIAYFNPPAQVGRAGDLPNSEHAAGFAAWLPQGISSNNDTRAGGFAAFLSKLGDGQVANNLTTDWCSSPPEFVGGQLWVTCQDNGFLALRFTNGVYPLA